MTISHLVLWLAATAGPSPTATVYSADPAHSLLDFTTRLVGLNRVRGSFSRWSADIAYDPAHPAISSVTFIAEVASIRTDEEERDQHLKTADFFDAAQFPTIRFQSTTVTPTPTGLAVEGDLTIKGMTRHIRLPASLLFPEARDPFGNRRIVFGTRITINRRDFGINGPKFWGAAIADSVTIEAEIAARVWNYQTRGFGRPDARYGPQLVAAAESGSFGPTLKRIRAELQAATDSTLAPRPPEIEVAAMRLAHTGRLAEARGILEVGLDIMGRRWASAERAAVEVDLVEVLFSLGQMGIARERIAHALTLDADSTRAIEWQRLIAATTGVETRRP